MREEVGQFRPTVGCLHLTTSTLTVIERLCAYAGLGPALPGVGMGYSLSKSTYNLRTSTRAPYASAAPVRCRKVVYPGGARQGPVVSHATAVSSAYRAESLGL